MKKLPWQISFTIPLVLLLCGCSPMVEKAQSSRTGSIPLDSSSSVGQTLTSHYRGLDGIIVHLQPGQPGDGTIRLHLKNSASSTEDLETAELSADQVTQPGWYRFSFPSQQDSNQKDYFYELEVDGEGSLKASNGSGDLYLDGALYQNGEPLDAQTAFRLEYTGNQLLIGFFLEVLTWLEWLLASIFLFLIPGWAMVGSVHPRWRGLSWGEKLALAGGTSLAVYPIIYLWMFVLGIRAGNVISWLVPILGLAMISYRNRFLLMHPGLFFRAVIGKIPHTISSIPWTGVTFWLVAALIVGSRLWVIRNLNLPLWGDSYQHTMIAQLIVDHDGLFQNWLPYAELTTFTYHFGFHTLVATFHWVTGLNIAQSTLIVGQTLNIVAVLMIYPLAVQLGRSPWAGVAAVFVAGLILPVPMTYVNWGRYTQLAGLAILPSAILLIWEFLSIRKYSWGLALLNWVVLGGLALVHYRILIFALGFIPAFILFNLKRHLFWKLVSGVCIIGIGAFLIALPWILHVSSGGIMRNFASQITTSAANVSPFLEEYNATGNLSTYLPYWMWVLIPAVLAWGFWRRERDTAILCLWWFIIFLAANPKWLSLPGTGVLSNFAVLIAIYFPAGILVGAAIGWAIESFQTNGKLTTNPMITSPVMQGGLLVLILCITFIFGLLYARIRLSDVKISLSTLATRPDKRAATWIQSNTSSEARFLVNSFSAYGDSLIAGSDGGWWLPLLAGRLTSQPPLNYGVEEGTAPNFRSSTNRLVHEIQEKGISHPDVLALLNNHRINYIYIGQRRGNVNSPGPLLDASQLATNPHFQLIYQQDLVQIYKILNESINQNY